ncbi:MAG: hypothetical protein V3U60_09555 [Gammaproteobacteria bacterium]
MAVNLRISAETPVVAPLLDNDDFLIRRSDENFRVNAFELLVSNYAQNPTGGIYVTTDPTQIPLSDSHPDGTIRIVFTPGETEAHIELKTSGVYNDTGFRISGSTLKLGRDMSISSTAGWLETENASQLVGHLRSLLPHIEFSDAGTLNPQSPIVDVLKTFPVFTGAVGEVSGTVLGQGYIVSPTRIVKNSFHESGSIAAGADVTHRLYVGADNTGVLFNQFIIPQAAFTADTTLIINYDKELGFPNGQSFFMELTSPATFSLKTDSGGNILTIHEGQELKTEDVVLSNLVVKNDAGFLLFNDGGFVKNNAF